MDEARGRHTKVGDREPDQVGGHVVETRVERLRAKEESEGVKSGGVAGKGKKA